MLRWLLEWCLYYIADWLKAAQSFMVLGMMALFGAVAVVAIIAFVPDFDGDLRILGAGIAVTGTAGTAAVV